MFTVSKLFWWVVDPSNLLLLMLLAATALLWSRWRRLGRRLVLVTAALALAVAVLPIGGWLSAPLENRFPAVRTLESPPDGIVVLGGVVNRRLTVARGQAALTDGVERLTEFVAIARRYPEARLVFTGGSGSLFDQTVKETMVARRLFADIGFDAARVIYEDQSRNTYENAVLTRRLVQPRPEETWLLITSAMHMPRAVGVFRKAGWRIRPYPVDYTTDGNGVFGLRFRLSTGLVGFSDAVHEWVGLAAYRLLGRSDSLFPGPAD